MAKVVRGVDCYKKEFLSIFNSLCGRHGRWEVWSDFIQLTAIDISNVTDKGNAPKRAADARNIAKKYSEHFAKSCSGVLVFFMKLFAPLSRLLTKIGQAAARLTPGDGETSMT